jgi:hypothetical protein
MLLATNPTRTPARTSIIILIGVAILIVAGLAIYFASIGTSTTAPTPASSPTASTNPRSPGFSPSPSPAASPSPLQPPVVTSARNWAGYVVASDLSNPDAKVVGVSASWTVPSVTDIGIDAFSAAWIGIGGQFDRSLIQAGTEQDFVGGQPVYSAWYELLPDTSNPIDSIRVSPGDRIEASIKLTDSGSNLWQITLNDVTSGQKFQQSFTYDAGKLSADWIIERPVLTNGFSGGLTPLANFGSITFSNCQAVFSDKTGSIYNFPSSKVIMGAQVSLGQMVQLVNVSDLSGDGRTFTVTYVAG